ncbi:FMN-binding protein [Planctomicrobium piriforme]|uniref:4Fe-4S binding domain-containing protein n=1 Tax=Planctomicrobium piriforme TaxID=1576369 RepID=A0A1I3JG69_9PLAN|nr:FMN-binding protein [Planctomicrobium piriforme]SFI59174.1 4Fe-4S binding domain-containing protein [Planctomicrobium piriforme]
MAASPAGRPVRIASRPRKLAGVLLHAARIGLLAVILLLMHWQHVRALTAQRAAGLETVPISNVQALFPTATALGEIESHGGRTVLAGEKPIGSVLQTFPEAQPFLGFSGPTNCLIGFDEQGLVVGLAILSSRDTRDHVELIRKDARFLSALNRRNAGDVAQADVDAVTGATLTSLAILQGIQARLGKQPESLKFPDAYTVEDARRLFPTATAVARDAQAPELWQVTGEKGVPLGSLLSNSPAADQIVGYQGPTRAFLGMNLEGKVVSLIVGASYENEPYVGYVRDDAWFAEIFNGRTLEELGKTRFEDSGVEGVSGATMTSQAVAEGLLLAAQKITELRSKQQQERQQSQAVRWKSAVTIGIVLAGLLIGLTPLRGRTWLRRGYQLVLIAVLGFWNADLLSMAMFVGWAQSGIPWTNALGLVCLTAAAVVLPIFTKQNVYCDHLCPHGAAQQLLPRKWKLQRRPQWLVKSLSTIRPVLLAIVVVSPLLQWNVSMVDLEPFDAYAWRAAGVATIAIAVIGLIASLFLPMGYCHYGCPTGAVLGYLRRHARSDRLTRSDAIAASLLILAIICFLR